MKKHRIYCIVCVLVLLCTGLQAAAGSPVNNRSAGNTPSTSYTNGNWINDIAAASGGCIWAAGPGGAVHWDTAAQSYEKFTSEYGLCSNQRSAVAVAPDGAVWIGTRDYWPMTGGSGAAVFRDGAWISVNTSDGLSSNAVSDIAVTQTGIWFATLGGLNQCIMNPAQ